MTINVSKCTRWVSRRYYTVDPMLSPSGNSFKCHEEVLNLQPMIPPKRVHVFSLLAGGCSEGLDAFRFFKHHPEGKNVHKILGKTASPNKQKEKNKKTRVAIGAPAYRRTIERRATASTKA